jgi:MFS family permease
VKNRGVLSALAHRSFALVWAGALVSNVGSWMETFTQHWLVYEVSRSTTWSGFLPFAATVPAIFLSLPMGIVADRVDRRRLLLLLQVLMAIVAAFQAIAAHLGHTEPGTIVAIAFLGGTVTGASGPAWQSLVPELVPSDDLAGAIALNSAQFNVARIAGPVLAALVIEGWGVAGSFDSNVLSFVLVIAALAVVPSRARPPKEGPLPRWQDDLAEGIRFARGHAGISRMLATGSLFLLGAAPVFALLPAFNKLRLCGDVKLLGTLFSSIGVGAITGALYMGRVGRKSTRRMAIASSALIVCGAIGGLAVTRQEDVARSLLFLYGFGWCVLLTTQNIAMQHLAPDKLRGRVMSLNTLSFFSMYPIGALAAGAAAERWDLPVVLAVMASGCALVGLWQLVSPVSEVEG